MSGSSLRAAAREILRAALLAVDPAEAVRRHLRREGGTLLAGGVSYPLESVDRIVVVGAGKASGAMTVAVEGIVEDRIEGGVVLVPYGQRLPTRRVRVEEAGHPIPDEAGQQGAEVILSLVRRAGERDLVIAVLSGGGSALLPLPVDGVSLAHKQEMTRQLLACGATIREINVIRKHLSRIKGGRLAAAAAGARVIALILSDVVGDPLDSIASGPTAPDPTTYADACAILERYGLDRTAPRAVLGHLYQGVKGRAPETPKPQDPLFARVRNLIVGSNLQALLAAAERARGLGLSPLILSSSIEGEAREVAKVHAALAREVRASGNPVPPPACLISGGETTVTLRGTGVGGRNQEFALAAAVEIEGLRDIVALSAGTDGRNGSTDAAGAVADGTTLERARAIGLDPVGSLRNNDSHRLFRELGDLVVTGPTHTNVMDIRLFVIG
ncbi:MAG: glycerate kinase type-2 family protein, partial [Candidatus Methylomirabilaceae bacterium]